MPPPELKFVWDGQQLFQGLSGAAGESIRPVDLDGKPFVGEDNRGVPYSSAWGLTDAGLRVRWKQQQAVGSNVYRIDDRDHTLIVEHTIEVTATSNIAPIVFLSRFSRKATPLSGRRPTQVVEKPVGR